MAVKCLLRTSSAVMSSAAIAIKARQLWQAEKYNPEKLQMCHLPQFAIQVG